MLCCQCSEIPRSLGHKGPQCTARPALDPMHLATTWAAGAVVPATEAAMPCSTPPRLPFAPLVFGGASRAEVLRSPLPQAGGLLSSQKQLCPETGRCWATAPLLLYGSYSGCYRPRKEVTRRGRGQSGPHGALCGPQLPLPTHVLGPAFPQAFPWGQEEAQARPAVALRLAPVMNQGRWAQGGAPPPEEPLPQLCYLLLRRGVWFYGGRAAASAGSLRTTSLSPASPGL